MSKHWAKWSIDSIPQDIVESVMQVVNDIVRKNNIQINGDYDHDEDLNYHIEFYEERIIRKD